MQPMAQASLPNQDWLTEAFAIVEHTDDMDGVVSKLRDFSPSTMSSTTRPSWKLRPFRTFA